MTPRVLWVNCAIAVGTAFNLNDALNAFLKDNVFDYITLDEVAKSDQHPQLHTHRTSPSPKSQVPCAVTISQLVQREVVMLPFRSQFLSTVTADDPKGSVSELFAVGIPFNFTYALNAFFKDNESSGFPLDEVAKNLQAFPSDMHKIKTFSPSSGSMFTGVLFMLFPAFVKSAPMSSEEWGTGNAMGEEDSPSRRLPRALFYDGEDPEPAQMCEMQRAQTDALLAFHDKIHTGDFHWCPASPCDLWPDLVKFCLTCLDGRKFFAFVTSPYVLDCKDGAEPRLWDKLGGSEIGRSTIDNAALTEDTSSAMVWTIIGAVSGTAMVIVGGVALGKRLWKHFQRDSIQEGQQNLSYNKLGTGNKNGGEIYVSSSSTPALS